MTWINQSLCGLLAFSLALPLFTPSTARAAGDDDPTNEIVAFGILGAVIGIVAYLGWKMDQEDKRYYSDSGLLNQAVAETGSPGSLRLLSPSAREGEQVAGLGYEWVF